MAYNHKEYMKEYHKEYYSKPENKERQKEYHKEYYSRPEVTEHRKEYYKEYYSKPEVREHRKEYVKEYYSKPGAKERQKEYMKEYYSKPEVIERRKEYYSSIPGKLASIKSRSRIKNLEFNVTLEYLESIYPDDSLCPLLNIPLDWNAPSKHPSTPSVDRIDSSKGYIKGNVQWVSWRANRLMSDATPDELLMVAQNYKKIYDQTILS